MPSTLLPAYLGQGLAAARPVTPAIATGTIGLYFATDTGAYFIYANGAWQVPGSNQFTMLPSGSLSADAQAFGSRGNILAPLTNMTLRQAWYQFTAVNTGVYKIGIAPYNTGTNQMTSAPTYTASFTAAASALTSGVLQFASPFALLAGTSYILFLVRTDVVGTTSLNMQFNSTEIDVPGFQQIATAKALKLASNNPLTSDTWTTGTAIYAVLPIYSIP